MITELLPSGSRVLCAVSGGADSMALLHLLAQKPELELRVAHFEHGLRGEEALRDAAFVERWCRERGIPCVIGHGDAAAHARERGLGIEEAARELRYAFLERTADELRCDRIATAHNADDNAETILFHLLRGSGPEGLRGIPRQRGRIVRPLLDTTRAEIDRYLEENGIPHVEDSSNASELYARNLLRRRVLPVLRELNPRASEAMGRAARLLERDEEYLAEQTAAFLAASFDGESLPLEALRALHPALASRVIRAVWPASLDFEQVEAALSFLDSSEYGLLDLPGGRLRREQGRLYLSGEELPPALPERELPLEGCLRIPEARLVIRSERAEKKEEINGLFKTYDFSCERIRGKIVCTGRRNGDRFHPAGRGCGKSLRALFNEAGLTQSERARVPVLRDEAGILAVLGFGQDERSCAENGEDVIRITWAEDEA